jgi:hypothetical protein
MARQAVHGVLTDKADFAARLKTRQQGEKISGEKKDKDANQTSPKHKPLVFGDEGFDDPKRLTQGSGKDHRLKLIREISTKMTVRMIVRLKMIFSTPLLEWYI